jgi:L-alanine-DL-glutamate epimerase-like enolase superfamily enzyme
MKITSVESFHIAVPYTYGGGLAKADALPWRKMETLLVKVSTDEGVVGWGEGFGFATCNITKAAVDKAVAPLVTGRDPRDMAKLNDELAHKLHNCNRNGPVAYAMSAFDIALWDIRQTALPDAGRHRKDGPHAGLCEPAALRLRRPRAAEIRRGGRARLQPGQAP